MGLKIRFRKECRFEPDRPHQSFRFSSGEQPAAALGPASIGAVASAGRMCRFRWGRAPLRAEFLPRFAVVSAVESRPQADFDPAQCVGDPGLTECDRMWRT